MNRIIYASSQDSDMMYATGFTIADPVFYLSTGRKKFLFLDRREFGMFKPRRGDQGLRPVLVEPLYDEAMKEAGKGTGREKLAYYLLEKYKLLKSAVYVPTSFPLDLADYLRARGIKLVPLRPFFPERAIKRPDEVRTIEKNLYNTKKAYRRIEEIIASSIVRGQRIFFEGRILTSERLRAEADNVLLKYNLVSSDEMIVSSGPQAAIPHHPGFGLIRPHAPIICDLFPRNRQNGYFADMTRTYFKVQPPDKVIALYETVRKVQAAAIGAVRPGVRGQESYKLCVKMFQAAGYHADEKGFTHAAGHGLGLDAHEGPSLGKFSSEPLKPGHVVTIEPGLYYPRLGGVRIEDVVVVTKTGCRNLTNYPKKLKIF